MVNIYTPRTLMPAIFILFTVIDELVVHRYIEVPIDYNLTHRRFGWTFPLTKQPVAILRKALRNTFCH